MKKIFLFFLLVMGAGPVDSHASNTPEEALAICQSESYRCAYFQIGVFQSCFFSNEGFRFLGGSLYGYIIRANALCSSGATPTNGYYYFTQNCSPESKPNYYTNRCEPICLASQTLDPTTNQCHTAYQFPSKTIGSPQLCVGNPCDPATGNKYQAETDFGSDAVGLNFTRHYNSGAGNVNGPLGYGWTHQLAPNLEILIGKIFVHQVDGRAEWFTSSNGLWQGDADSLLRLTQDASGYTLTDQLGVVERYNTSGRIVSRTEASGRTTTYSYDSSQRLATVTGPFGHSLQLAYDNTNRVGSVTYPDGLSSQYQYDGQGNLSRVIYPDGSFKLYHYEHTAFPHALTGITDENGNRYATWSYDSQGRANLSQHAGGAERVTLSYNNDNGTDVVDSFNASRHYTFQTILNVQKLTGISQPAGTGSVAATRTQSYDANGNIASRTDFNGNLSCYAYDLTRNLETTRIEGLAPGASCPANLSTYTPVPNSIERKIVSQWHASYRLPTQIDQAGQRLNLTYDAAGNLLTKTVTDTASQQSRTLTYTYNSLGQILTADGPRTDVNDITTYSYYADTTATHHVGDLHTVSNALGHVTTFSAYDANGRLLSLTDPNGLVISFAYDTRGRLTEKTVDGNSTQYTYDAVGNLIKVTQPSGVYIAYSYDAAHRLTDITDALGGKIHYTLDTMGNRTKEDILDSSSVVVKTHSRVYDALSRLAQDIGAYNQTTNYQYDTNGNLTQVTDINGHATQHQYDSLDRLIRSTDALAGLTDYQYDGQDRLTQVTDANNHSTVYSYNGLGDLTQLESPNTGITQYSYDSAGNLAQKTDATNTVGQYRHDALNRLTNLDYLGSNPLHIANTYDGNFAPTSGETPFQIGRLTASSRGAVTDSYRYDLRGNLISSTGLTLFTGPNEKINYSFNQDNRITGIAFSNYRHVHYQYDATGQVSGITVHDLNGDVYSNNNISSTRVLATDIARLPFGPITGLNYGNGLTLSRSYNLDYARTGQTVGNLQNLAYSYDPVGNLQTANDLLAPGSNQHYSYDPLRRLTEISGSNGWGYRYDAVGNRTAERQGTTETLYHYALDSQKLLTQTGTRPDILQSNALGNLTQAGGKSYGYWPDQRLLSVRQGITNIATYEYDAQGQRRVKRSFAGSGGRTYFDYDPQGRLIGEMGGNTWGNYVYLDGEPLARIDSAFSDADGYIGNGNVVYFHNNPVGAPLATTDRLGQLSWIAQMAPFGKVLPINPAITQNLRFPGQYHDAETGLYYNMQRYYDPNTGRYLQSDPIGLAGGLNTYTYVNNNPLKFIDPLGLMGLWIEGSSAGEPGPHQSLGVGDPNGANQTYSFGVMSGQSPFGGTGSVYLDANKGGTLNKYYDVPDSKLPAIKNELNRMLGHRGKYNLFTNNCRNFSNATQDYLVDKYNLQSSPIPERVPTESGSLPGGSTGAPTTDTGVWTSSPGPTD